MKADTVKEVLDKLVGPVVPVGETEEDEIRLGNLHILCRLAIKIMCDLEHVTLFAGDSRGSCAKAGASAKRELGRHYDALNELLHSDGLSVGDVQTLSGLLDELLEGANSGFKVVGTTEDSMTVKFNVVRVEEDGYIGFAGY